ncbi:hypothetical protein BC831DRAFT_345 [Entophlyctis helioformis]|nr:hypothetical protein BC831DRAFT_345 [Entophlyctis helioformis]
MLEQADPRIAALTLERLVKRSLELRGSAGMETSGSDSNNIKDSNGLGSGGVGLAAPAVCHQHRLEANVKAMREILDALVAAASPSIAQQRLDTIQAQVQIYSDWVDQQKLRQTVDHHQRKELQDRSELHQETGAESVDAATADKASQLRAQLLKLPRFPLRQRIPAQSKDTPDASQPHSPQEPRTSFPDAQLRLEARRSLLGRDSQTKDDTTDAAAASVGTNSTALAAILERNRREQGCCPMTWRCRLSGSSRTVCSSRTR